MHENPESGPSTVVPSAATGQPTRRTFLRGSAAAGVGVAMAAGVTTGPGTATAAPHQVFAHGVASGDPMPDRVILWTRVTPTPTATPGVGRGPSVTIGWQVSTDSGFGSVVASGSVSTGPDSDYTVKVDATGLSPRQAYFYRFTLTGGPVTGSVSPIGRTKTAPSLDSDPSRLRFGVVSCANWEAGYFSAYRHLSNHRDLDAVVHLGDYLYEYEAGGYTGKGSAVRKHSPGHEIVRLRDYRMRHAQYKTDPDLQRLHGQVPFICTWDDHESANDAYKTGAENHQPKEGAWAARKAASERAYYEWMPVRVAADQNGRHLYRRLQFGRLADLSMLDLRTYRDEQVSATKAKVDDPARSITGAAQMSWLVDNLGSTSARWKIIGNPVMISPVVVPPLDEKNTAALTKLLGIPKGGIPVNADSWDGYTADRDRLLNTIRSKGIRNTVFITGDIHSSWACDVPVNAAGYPAAGTVATELVIPSVTSSNIDDELKVPEHTASNVVTAALYQVNRHVRWNDMDAHGYGVFTLTSAAAQMDWHFVNEKTDPRSGQYHAKSYRVRNGVAAAEPVGRAIG